MDEFDNLLKQQPDIVNSLRDVFDGYTLLMRGARMGDKRIVSLLSKRAHDLSVVDNIGHNVLHDIVADNNDDDSLDLLNSLDVAQLSSDVVNHQNQYNDTPLYLAAMANNHKTIVWLFEHGAGPSMEIPGKRPGEDEDCDDETRKLIRSFQSKWNILSFFRFRISFGCIAFTEPKLFFM